MPRKIETGECSMPGCLNPIRAKGLCGRHYWRLWHHGSPEDRRPEHWGSVRKHPLNSAWERLLQQVREGAPMPPEWENNFKQFVNDVGPDRPPNHRFMPKNKSLPLGPKNFQWVPIVARRQPEESQKEYLKRRYEKIKKADPDHLRGPSLWKNFGITVAQFDEMLAKQNGVCAICKNAESRIHGGRKRRPAVDHNALTMTVRGLLCSACNRGLGFFRHNPEWLRDAAAYLETPPFSIQMPPSAGRYHKVRGPGATRSEREKQAAKIEKEQKK